MSGSASGQSLDELFEQLKSPNADVRQKAVEEIKYLDQAVVPTLINELKEAPSVGYTYHALIIGAFSALGPRAKAGVPILIEQFDFEEDPFPIRPGHDIPWRAAWALEQIGDSAAPHLIKALKHEKKHTRYFAEYALENIGSRAVPMLIRALGDTDPQIRLKASDILGHLRSTSAPAVPALITLLRDEHVDVRKSAKEALIDIGAPSVKPVLKLLSDEDVKIRESAAEIISRAGYATQETLPTLVERLKLEEIESGRVRIYWALAGIAYSVKKHQGEQTNELLEILIQGLDSENPEIRKSCANGLGNLEEGAKSGVPALIQRLKDKHPDVISEAAKALGYIGAKEAIKDLLKALDDSVTACEWWTFLRVADALKKLGADNNDLIPIYIRGLSAKRSRSLIPSSASDFLGDIGEEAIPALREAAKSDNPEVVEYANWALYRINAKKQ